jgi:3-isopropylmalate/(R)-2-methylmalate dehydratase large subunit
MKAGDVMNAIERIIAQKSGRAFVKPGDELSAEVDLVIAHDVTGPMAVTQFEKIGADRVFDKEKVVFVVDHNIPASSVESRRNQRLLRKFAQKVGIRLYDKGEGVVHQVVAEKGLYKKGDLIVGADSHTCTAGAFGAIAIPVGSTELAAAMALGTIDIEVPETYLIRVEGRLKPGVYAKDLILYIIGRFGTGYFTDKAVILSGDTIIGLTDEEKMTVSNMTIEMGAMIGYIDQGDAVGEVKEIHTIDADKIEPLAACPYSPGNVKPLREVEGRPITQIVIGSCTNGRYSDMKIAADVLKNKKVCDSVNLVIVPASKTVLDKMEEEGLTKVLRDAGAIIGNPGCGPCFGAHQGLLSEDDVALSTTNRNFPGRMGHKKAEIYLVSPRTAAESAVTGYITRPGTIAELEG